VKQCRHKTVFSCCWNVVKDAAVLTGAGRLFQAHDTATENARSPSVTTVRRRHNQRITV